MSRDNTHIKLEVISAYKLKFTIAKSFRRINSFLQYLSILTLLVSVFIFVPTGLSAQRDTTGTSAKTDSIIEYLTPLEYAFMMHEETKFMIRVPAVGLGAEVEILPYLTLLGQFYYRNNRISYYYDYYPSLDAQMRYYYGSKKKGVRNMSGNYFAIGYENPTIFSKEFDTGFYYGRWGVQRRFIGYGLIDIGINAGFYSEKNFTYNDFVRTRQGLFIQSTAQVGLGIVFGNEKALDKEKLCSVVKCYEKETFLLKIKTSNLFSLFRQMNNERHEIQIGPKISIEQKLFNLPVSIGGDLSLEYTWWQDKGVPWKNRNSGSITGRAQARYYYNLKNRFLKGKSGDGLSGNYFSGGVYRSIDLLPDPVGYGLGYTLSTGVQRTFSDHFFFDVEIGFQNGSSDYIYYSGFDVFGDIQVGIKF